MEARGRARATVTRRLCTIAGFYRYAVEEDLLEHSPAAHVRRPRLDDESHAMGLDRNELGALLIAAGLGAAAEHDRARASLDRHATYIVAAYVARGRPVVTLRGQHPVLRAGALMLVEQRQAVLLSEVGGVERHQRHLIAQAAGCDPGVILRPGPSPQLGGSGQLAPYPGNLRLVGDNRTCGRSVFQAPAPVLSPPAHHGPLRQLAHGDKGQPDPGTVNMTQNPRGRLVLLKQRRGVGVYYDVPHGRSGQRSVPARPQVGKERLQFPIRLPHLDAPLRRTAPPP